MDSDSEMLEMPALGRPFSLGMLYDCRNDSLIPGVTLWDRDELESSDYTRETSLPNSDFETLTSESNEDKFSALNVEGSLKASVYCGLVRPEGSFKYLNDSKTSNNQARVTLKYKYTKRFTELSMSHLGRDNVKHPYLFDKGIATHVVTGIQYGAQAFFVFDRELSGKENPNEVESNLKLAITKIPKLSGEDETKDIDMSSAEEFSCKFYGDFHLDKNPLSFLDAIQVYQSLPELNRYNENTVPMKVWLMPLERLDSAAAQPVHQISAQLINQTTRFFDFLRSMEMRCNDAMKSSTGRHFPPIGEKVKIFKELCSEYKQRYQRILAEKLPLIRAGREEEAVLAELLEERQSSPFNSKIQSEWIVCKEREINILKCLIDKMKNANIDTSGNALDHEILNAEQAVCFAFPSLENSDPYLSALSNYLKETPKADCPQETTYTHDLEKEQWYFSKDILDAMRQKAKLFCDFAEANKENKNICFLTAGVANEVQKGASIHLYKEGSLVTENFEPPSKPETLELENDRTGSDSVTMKIDPPQFGAEDVTHYLVEYSANGGSSWQQSAAPKAKQVTVSNLTPNTEYRFRYRAVSAVGIGPANEFGGAIKTLPSETIESNLD